MTYKEIEIRYRQEYGKTIKSCWIADVKRELKLTKRISHNRIDRNYVTNPCPNDEIRQRIKRILLVNS